jgi:hypothetical protein
MKLLGFRLLAATIDIAALVKSVGAAYQEVGPGRCQDSSGKDYDYVYLNNQESLSVLPIKRWDQGGVKILVVKTMTMFI